MGSFWTPTELANSAGAFRELYSEPQEYRELRWTVHQAQIALSGSKP